MMTTLCNQNIFYKRNGDATPWN